MVTLCNSTNFQWACIQPLTLWVPPSRTQVQKNLLKKLPLSKKFMVFMNFKIQSTMTKWCNGSKNLHKLPQGVHGSNKCKVLSSKVEIPNSDTHLHRTPKFEWFVIWCGSKNGHQKGIMCLKEIGHRAHNMITIPGSIVNIIVGGGRGRTLIWPFSEHKNLHFNSEGDIHELQKLWKKWQQPWFTF